MAQPEESAAWPAPPPLVLHAAPVRHVRGGGRRQPEGRWRGSDICTSDALCPCFVLFDCQYVTFRYILGLQVLLRSGGTALPSAAP